MNIRMIFQCKNPACGHTEEHTLDTAPEKTGCPRCLGGIFTCVWSSATPVNRDDYPLNNAIRHVARIPAAAR